MPIGPVNPSNGPTPPSAEPGQPISGPLSPITITPEEVTIEEDDTPLGKTSTVEHICCILHLIIMCIALTIAIWYTHSRKKHQATQFELRRQLQLAI